MILVPVLSKPPPPLVHPSFDGLVGVATMFFPYAVGRLILASDNTTATSTFFSNASDACKDISNCRTISDIFLSCFTVVFISVWVPMHPDVPHVEHVGHSDVGNFLNQLIIMTLSLIFPEAVAARAFQQRKEAEELVTKYKKCGWTKPHAYLVIMGGLALYDKDGNFRGYLDDSEKFSDEDRILVDEIEQSLERRPHHDEHSTENSSCLLEYMLSRGLVDLTKSDIKANLSHGDVFAKLSALLSTGWFLVKITVRGVQGLVITELEVVALSFTAHNVAAYVIWRDKPQRIRFPVRVTWEPRLHTTPEAASPTLTYKRLLGRAMTLWRELCRRLVADFKSVIFKDVAAPKRRSTTWTLAMIGLYPAIFLGHQLDYLTGSYETRQKRRTAVNMSNSGGGSLGTIWVSIAMGIVVVALHFAAWNSQFPTALMRTAWLASASVLIAMPVVFLPVIFIANILEILTSRFRVTMLTVFLGLIGYSIARLTPVVLAILIPLEYGLPKSVCYAVEWAKFIPHIG
ncbi:hypothetical protein V5O48_018287 [Marasmius crinis-equi]|uniref:Uncharacterized protein n=1 Tax=Marasmius crinis-equi TaxID=585013 RepID=A0ABR3ELL3_9AGAR